jgi:serine/threonine protein kinase
MSPVTRPAGVKQPEVADERAIKAWLDALASGAFDESEFLLSVRERFKSDADGNWEVLSQLDQAYRRGRIKTEVFQAVKRALAESALGTGKIPEIPVARDVGVPPAALRAEPRDAHPHREEIQLQDPVLELKPGSVLRRRYRIETMLGQGAMGTVFQAVDEDRLDIPPAGQRLAIKVLHTAVTKRAELLTELRRAFQQMQRLSHPNIVRVFEFDRDGPVVFFAMELLNGALLSRVLQARKLIPLDQPLALAIIRDIGAAISYAHSRGVVHGDLNLQNVFITLPGELRVLDFGAWHRSNRRSPATDHEMTLPIAISGYASCQVLEGEHADARDDVFALACIAYLLLCGEHPFSKKTAIEARTARVSPRRPPNLANQQWQALRVGLRWEREDRPADVQQWLEQLNLSGAAKHLAPVAELLEPPPRMKPKSAFSKAVAAAVVLLLAGGYWISSQFGILPRVDGGVPIRTASEDSPPNTAPSAAARPADSTPSSLTERSPPPVAHAAPPVAHATPPLARAAPPLPPAHDAPAAALPAATPAATPSATPSTATAHVATSGGVAAGPSKIELAVDTLDVAAAESSAQVTVQRKGSLRGATSFTWWTESGTAKPGIDFSAVVPQLANIGDGKSSISLSIPVSNAPRVQSKSFYVVIEQSEGGAVLGARTLTMVTLLPGH